MALQGASTVAGTRSQVNERNAHRRLQSTLCPHNMSRHVNQHMHCHLHLTSLAHMLSPYFSLNSQHFHQVHSQRSAVFQRCCRRRRLPPVHRLPPGGDPWHEQRRDFGCDILPPSTEMFVWPPAIPLRTRFSAIFFHTVTHNCLIQLSDRLCSTTSLSLYHLNGDFITKCSNCPLTSLTLWMQITWSVILRSDWSISSQLTMTYNVTTSISM